ncbi:MAG TPA: acetoacetate--CoA ligase [Bacillota bacterium]|jgi:acetoacetyl-CoA synthetase|nr:acetoacetate--CoA ligase [Bacillota bacterium]HOP69975.1 acetoacetate--CoA ligase [Bacillota bacterium]HPT33653.1 acetoacetate--CoA ligase [Bacillota bacterium]HPZ64904.1 acetoacetate--CoA ligase [Bacillota bacterium]HQD06772.1 acetoacetate--CoA ligase [Bacillota bacterium]
MKKPLWVPGEKRRQEANLTAFMELVARRKGVKVADYHELYRWSIEQIPDFWELIWEYGEVRHSRSYDRIVDDLGKMPGCRWFEGARLNFAENLLRFRDERTAIIFKGEGRELRKMTYGELYREVFRLSRAMKAEGIKPGDRVAGFMPNMPETIVAMLAATSLGAIWSSCSPDFGVQGALDRFGQIEPRLLFSADGYYYNGKRFDSLEKMKGLLERIPSIEKVILVAYTEKPDLAGLPRAVHYQDFLAEEKGEIQFEQLPFDHPVYILYSSGTTGVPKCIVHGAGGTLLQHLKELKLHTDLKREDVIFYFTTCGWMMWNWLVSALAVGSTLVLYDGSPFYPEPGELFRLAEEVGISIFGTSARYLASLEQAGEKPGRRFRLESLKTILSTGSPLSVESFQYVYRDIKEDVCLSSISGGTDIVSCFVLGSPLLPVYPGEIQCRGLGMKVEVFDEQGRSVVNQKGELVCTAPFPSMPIYFWNDPDNKKYRSAYFEVYPGAWHHGDYMEITDTGGVIIYGRSDATLNPGGVRIGTAEIYRLMETLPEVEDSLVVGQDWKNDQRVILFLKMKDENQLSLELEKKIRDLIRKNTTPRHVPAKILPIGDIPYTINGKKVEIAVRKVIHGEEVKNKEALANPEALELYRDLPQLQE